MSTRSGSQRMSQSHTAWQAHMDPTEKMTVIGYLNSESLFPLDRGRATRGDAQPEAADAAHDKHLIEYCVLAMRIRDVILVVVQTHVTNAVD